MVKQLTKRQTEFFDNTVKMFKEAGCPTLETEYLPAKSKWRYLCECGEEREILPHDFKRGRRCKGCGMEKLRELNRTPVDEVKGYFSNTSDVLTDVYVTSGRTMVKYVCENSHTNEKAFYSYKAGYGCFKCSKSRLAERYRSSLEEVKAVFIEQGCELLEDVYINHDQKLKYKCSCGNISHSYLSAIKKGIKCGCQYLRGEESPHWNSSMTEEQRQGGRKYPEYYEWVKKVYERDNYTCQKCFERGGALNAHHIKGYAAHKELRTSLTNGITLCAKCHKYFHKVYGYNDFDEEGLLEFIDVAAHADELSWE